MTAAAAGKMGKAPPGDAVVDAADRALANLLETLHRTRSLAMRLQDRIPKVEGDNGDE